MLIPNSRETVEDGDLTKRDKTLREAVIPASGPMMTKSTKSISAQGGLMGRDIIIASMQEETYDNEESKLDPLGPSVDSSLAVTERGLIHQLLPPSATHPKNT